MSLSIWVNLYFYFHLKVFEESEDTPDPSHDGINALSSSRPALLTGTIMKQVIDKVSADPILSMGDLCNALVHLKTIHGNFLCKKYV